MSALTALRPPPGLDAVPEFDRGWRIDGAAEPFLAYEQVTDLNWSAELEELHEESSRDHFIDVLTPLGAACAGSAPTCAPAALVVDVGCSSGYLLADLRAAQPGATTVGVDLVPEGLRRAHAEVPTRRCCSPTASRCPSRTPRSMPSCRANVLEHVADDEGALREMHRILRPAGSPPSSSRPGPASTTPTTSFLGHERRYARRELARKGEPPACDVLDDAYLGSLLYPPFWRDQEAQPPPSPRPRRRRARRRWSSAASPRRRARASATLACRARARPARAHGAHPVRHPLPRRLPEAGMKDELLSIVVPAYKEEDNVQLALPRG